MFIFEIHFPSFLPSFLIIPKHLQSTPSEMDTDQVVVVAVVEAAVVDETFAA